MKILNLKFYRNKIVTIGTSVMLILMIVLTPIHQAQAYTSISGSAGGCAAGAATGAATGFVLTAWSFGWGAAVGAGIGCVLGGLAGWYSGKGLAGAVSSVITTLLNTLSGVLGWFLALVMSAFSYLVYIRIDNGMPVLTATWKILRDLANMFFIIALVWIAFATIFNVSNHRLQDMIGRLVFVAVLINFSLAIGGLVVNFSQVLVNVMLTSIGDPGLRLTQYLNAQALAVPGSLGDGLAPAIFGVILIAILVFTMLVATVFALFRIFIIWGLLVVSPVAWMAYILPGTKGTWKKWWGLFLGWNLYLPVQLFIMLIGFSFLSQKEVVMAAVSKSILQSGTTNPDTLAFFNMLFFYAFAATFLAYGIVMGTKLTTAFGGQGFEKGVGYAKNWVKRMPGFSSYYAAQNAAGARAKQFQQEGFRNPYLNKIYGGEAGAKRQEAAWQQTFGVQGSGKAFVKDASQAFERIEDEYDTGKLNVDELIKKVQSTNATSAQGYAYRKLAIKKGALNDSQFTDALGSAAKNPFMVQDLIKTAKEAKFAGIKDLKGVAFNDQVPIAARREILLHMSADPKQASRFNVEDISKAATSVLGGANSPEAKKFLDETAKVRPDLVYAFRRDNKLLVQPSEDAAGKRATMPTQYGAVRSALNIEPKNIAGMPDDLWKSDLFKTALKEKLYDPKVSQKSRNQLRSNLERALDEQGSDDKLTILNEIAPRNDFRQEQQQRGSPGNRTGQGRGNNPTGNQDQQPPPTGRGTGTGGRRSIGFSGTTQINQTPTDVNPENVIDLRSTPPEEKSQYSRPVIVDGGRVIGGRPLSNYEISLKRKGEIEESLSQLSQQLNSVQNTIDSGQTSALTHKQAEYLKGKINDLRAEKTSLENNQ